jgi:hypothetical protein
MNADVDRDSDIYEARIAIVRMLWKLREEALATLNTSQDIEGAIARLFVLESGELKEM